MDNSIAGQWCKIPEGASAAEIIRMAGIMFPDYALERYLDESFDDSPAYWEHLGVCRDKREGESTVKVFHNMDYGFSISYEVPWGSPCVGLTRKEVLTKKIYELQEELKGLGDDE